MLCVDDDEVSQLVLRGMLQSEDCAYAHARTGAEGLAALGIGGGGGGDGTSAGAGAGAGADLSSGGGGGSVGGSGGGHGAVPRLVLVDSGLPDMAGLAFVRAARARFSRRRLPIVVLTARWVLH